MTWVNTYDIHADILVDVAMLALEQSKPMSYLGTTWLICRTKEEGEACAQLLDKVVSWRVGRGGLYLEGGVGQKGWLGVAKALPRFVDLVGRQRMISLVYFGLVWFSLS